MIQIIKARNSTDPCDPPDDFDPPLYHKPGVEQSVPDDHPPAAEPDHPPRQILQNNSPSVDADGLLLSSSARPGHSQYQFVQKNQKTGLFRAVIPVHGKRQSFGPFQTDRDAALRVQEFLEQLRTDTAPLTRGQKRTQKFIAATNQQLDVLNRTAREQGRHHVPSLQTAMCTYCKKTVHKYHVLKFVQKQCTAISACTDKAGSTTRAQRLSATRTAELQATIDLHNQLAATRGQHIVACLQPKPKCSLCNQVVTRNYVQKWMVRTCPAAPTPLDEGTIPKISRRIRGKSNPLA